MIAVVPFAVRRTPCLGRLLVNVVEGANLIAGNVGGDGEFQFSSFLLFELLQGNYLLVLRIVFKYLNFTEDGLDNLPVLEDLETSAGMGTERSPAADACLIFLIRVLSQEPIQSFMSDFLRHQR